MLTSLAWFVSAKWSFKAKQKFDNKNTDVNSAYLALLAACKQNDGEAALANLLPWAQSQSSDNKDKASLTTLDSLHGYFNDKALSEAIIALQQSYYGKQPSPWVGQSLLNAVQTLHKKHHHKSSSTKVTINP